MTPDPESRPEGSAPDDAPARPRTGWRFGTPAVVLACGALFVTSFVNSEGTDLRPGRYTDLASVVESENTQYESLAARVRQVSADVERLTGLVGDSGTRKLQEQVEDLKGPAGLSPVAGPGLTVVLSDAPAEVINSSDQPIRYLIVHQQDIQAVVNAMWAGGAEAVTIQGQRVVSTTGIKCEGNAVMLGGGVYPQPYTISAIGDPAALEAAVLQDEDTALFRRDALQADISVGFEMTTETDLAMPAYEGVLGRTYAEPLT
jgi:uncharacterized protein YlxW (UPF0749 family)